LQFRYSNTRFSFFVLADCPYNVGFFSGVKRKYLVHFTSIYHVYLMYKVLLNLMKCCQYDHDTIVLWIAKMGGNLVQKIADFIDCEFSEWKWYEEVQIT